ncbi:MAG: hypothetical protein Q9M94_07840 [Candidatus Gracilibacteria bacterium]|nr:hypothetical protein [Candidatus Gracilibacteria bacterium]
MNILQKIIENKKEELENNKSNGKNFKKIFAKKDANIIGEIKIASPKFDYSNEINLEEVFKFYGENKDMKAISNLIDEKYFSGDILRGKNIKQKYNKPIFFKEFIISKTQIDGANYFGYDAILLLERVLSEKEIIDFSDYAIQKNIFPIIEIDTEKGLEKVLNLPLLTKDGLGEGFGIAINCRNLGTMELDRKKHFSIIKNYEKFLENKLVFAFSGIDNLEQIKEYKNKFNGVLVGSYFMNKLKNK